MKFLKTVANLIENINWVMFKIYDKGKSSFDKT